MIAIALGLAISIFLAILILAWIVLIDISSYLQSIAQSQKEAAAALYIIMKILRGQQDEDPLEDVKRILHLK